MENPQKTENAVETLMDLGLTNCQARIYLTLILNGHCTAVMLSKFSKVTRQDIYRILPKLQEIGLVRKILDIPVAWEATSLKEGLALLMDAQSKRYLGLQTKAADLLDNFIPLIKETANTEDHEFVIIPPGAQQLSWQKEIIEKLEKSWDGFTVFEGFGPGIFMYEEYFKKALDRGIKVRNIFFTTENKNEKRKRMLNSTSFKHENVCTRFLQSKANFVGMVIDSKEACICMQTTSASRTRKPTTSSILWSKNEVFVGILQNYYELLWNKAQELDLK